MAKESHQSVFVLLHQTKPEHQPDYALLTREYLPEDFFHPAYFFMRPDGTEVDTANRHCHEALAAKQMIDILKEIRKAWGPGLSEADYAKHGATLGEAEKLLAAGDASAARAALKPLAALRQKCGLADRARADLRFLDAIEALAKEVPAGEVADKVGRGDLVGALRELRRRAARDETAEVAAGKVIEVLKGNVKLAPVRYEPLVLQGISYHYLRAEWSTGLPPFCGLSVELAYLTDDGRALLGWGTFDDVAPFRRHRAAASLTGGFLRGARVANLRVRLMVGDALLAEELLRPAPAEFPVEKGGVVSGPDLISPDETLGTFVRGRLRGEWQVGRCPLAW
jgi:hypothetical protein